MGHDKLRKFAENETFACLIQPSASELLVDGFEHLHDHALKGHWREWFAGVDAGLVAGAGGGATPDIRASVAKQVLTSATATHEAHSKNSVRPSSPLQPAASTSLPGVLSEAKSASAAVPQLSSDARREGTAKSEAAGAVPLWGAGGLTRNEVPRMIGAPIILELGCGKGEYTLELARRNPDKFYIGVDIKGARLWRGAKTATQEGLKNVAFLRTRIEFIGAFFGPDEVSEIWLTFSDPQMKSENSRLTSPVFLERYRRFLRPGGIVHLKTDSRFLHLYTLAVATVNSFPLLACTENLYEEATATHEAYSKNSVRPSSPLPPAPPSSLPAPPSSLPAATGNLSAIPSEVREVQTYYESMFLAQGLPITYMAFTIDGQAPIAYPRDPEDFDSKAMRAAEKARLE